MRHRLTLYFATFILATVGFLIFDYSLRKDYLTRKNIPRVDKTAAIEQEKKYLSVEQRTRFLNRFRNFASQMAALSDEPETSDEVLAEFSKLIQPDDIFVLSDVLNDTNNKNNERSLALELMTTHQDFNCHNLLNNFVQNEQIGNGEKADFEIALRAQAIEGLTLYTDKKLVRKNLENFKIRTRYAFLHDRANRALDYISGNNLTTPVDSADAKASK